MKPVERELLFGEQMKERIPIALFALAISTLILGGARLAIDGQFSIVVVIQTFSAVVFALGAILFRTRFNVAASHLVLSLGAVVIFLTAFLDGGIGAHSLFWLVFVPFLAPFLTSENSAVIYTIAILVGLGFLSALSSFSFHHVSLGVAVIFSCGVSVILERVRHGYENRITEITAS